MKLLSVLSLSLVLSCTTLSAQKVYEISAFGLKANSSKNASPVLQKALAKIKQIETTGRKRLWESIRPMQYLDLEDMEEVWRRSWQRTAQRW